MAARRNPPAPKRRPSRRGKARTHRPAPRDTLWSVGPHVERVRARANKRRVGKAAVAVIPSDRWRPMRRVAGVPWKGDGTERLDETGDRALVEEEPLVEDETSR